MVAQHPALVPILVFLFIMLLRNVYFHKKLRSTQRYWSEYQSYLDAISKNANDWQSYDKFAESHTEMKKLFQQAGLSSVTVPVFEKAPIGRNLKVQTGTAQTWDHLDTTDELFVATNRKTLHEAIGYFRGRRNETCSIVYWIETVIFWPRHVLTYLGLNKDSSTTKVLHILAVVAELAGGIVLILDRIPN